MNQHTRPDTAPIPFIDVAAQRRRLGRKVDDAIARVLDHCQFIMGPEVRALEAETMNLIFAAPTGERAGAIWIEPPISPLIESQFELRRSDSGHFLIGVTVR